MRVLLRIIATFVGIVLLTLSVLVRYSFETISAGHWQVFFRFGHPDPSDWFSVPLVLLMAVTAAGFLCLLFIRPVRQAVGNLLGNRQRLIWAASAVFVWVLTMVPLDAAKAPPYLTDQVTYVYLLFGSLGLLSFMLGLGGLLDFAGRWAVRGYELILRMPARTLVLGCAAIVFVAANLVSWLVFNHIPHVQDTVAQIFQARLFAQGKLFAQSVPYAQFFDIPQIINNGQWYSQYPFGHPLFLMLGVLIGAPWIINPLLGALTVVVIYYVGREVYDEATARIGTVLATLSPYLLFMSSEFMSHSSALLMAALFLLCYARAMRTSQPGIPSAAGTKPDAARIGPAILAGLCMGMVVNVRPFTGLLLVLPFALDAGYRVLRDRRRYGREVAVMIGAGAVVVAMLLLYNYFTSGGPFRFGYVVKWGPGHEIGFGHSGWGEPYTLARALVGNTGELYALNRYLFEFPIPSLIFIVLLFAAMTRNRWDWLLLGTAAALTVGYFFYWWHSILFGPRWQYEALPGLVLLTARGLRAIPGLLETRSEPVFPRERVRLGVGKLLVLCYVSLFAVALPSRITRYVRDGFGILASSAKTVKKANVHNAIVFARKYEETFLLNSFPPGGDIIYARDLRGANPLLTRQLPGRQCFLVNRDTLFQMQDVEYEQSPLKVGLDGILKMLDTVNMSGYKTLFWPAAELSELIEPLARRQKIPVVTYRELGQRLFGDVTGVRDYLPALAVWIVTDRSDGLAVFTNMDRKADQNVGPFRFHHLATTANGAVTLFEIK
jgi:hypothetical protein